MAIEKIKEVYLFSLKKDFPSFFDFLKREEKIHIDSVKEINGLSVFKDVNVSKFDKEISELETIINELEKFGERKSLIKSFIPERIELEEEEFKKIVREFDHKSIYNRVMDYIKEEERILDGIKNIKKLLTSLLPYSSFELELENLDKLTTVSIIIAIVLMTMVSAGALFVFANLQRQVSQKRRDVVANLQLLGIDPWTLRVSSVVWAIIVGVMSGGLALGATALLWQLFCKRVVAIPFYEADIMLILLLIPVMLSLISVLAIRSLANHGRNRPV